MRWKLKLEKYENNIVPKLGKMNSNADALNQIYLPRVNPMSEFQIFLETEEKKIIINQKVIELK